MKTTAPHDKKINIFPKIGVLPPLSVKQWRVNILRDCNGI